MEQKGCIDCIHHAQHYAISNGRFRPVICGHCTNRKPSGHFRKTNAPCEMFEARDLQKEKDAQLTSAVEWLTFIGERLNELTQILNSDT